MIRNKHFFTRAGLLFTNFILLFYTLSVPIASLAFAENMELEPELGIIIIPEELDEIPVYEKDDETSEIVGYLKSEDEILILESKIDMSLIELIDTEDQEESKLEKENDELDLEPLTGYVDNEFIELVGFEEELDTPEYEVEIPEIEDEMEVSEEDIITSIPDKNISSDEGTLVDPVIPDHTEDAPPIVQGNSMTMSAPVNPVISGVALKNKTTVYSDQSRNSKALKSYKIGSVLKYRELNSNWHAATVYINGKATPGYIHVSDVDDLLPKQESLYGIALNSTTHVYSGPSTDSKVHKSYAKNSVLKFSSFSKDWYKTGVFINGKKHTGYIHRSHVEASVTESEKISLNGIALKSPTNIYLNASTGSRVLKSYSKNSVLKFSTFTKDWYQTGVFINGKKHIGYIHKSHVETAVAASEKVSHSGIALKSPTNVYSSTSTGSKILKSYRKDSVLKFSTFSKDWYQTGVYINGKKQTGYIHKSHVETALTPDKQVSLYGIGLQSPTKVYSGTSTGSKVLRTYPKDRTLKFSTFSSNWYQTGVFINGKKQVGYIHKSHVNTTFLEENSMRGLAVNSPTNIYKADSTSSGIHTSFAKGSILSYEPYSNNYYRVTVYVNGVKQNGYVLKSHVEDVDNKYSSVVKYANKSQTNVYTIASKSSAVLRSYPLNRKLTLRTFSNDWFEARMFINGEPVIGYIHKDDVSDTTTPLKATTSYKYTLKHMVDVQMRKSPGPNQDGGGRVLSTRGEVEFYTNPLNFPEGSTGYYQFLVLNEPAGLDAAELNRTILKGKGILDGQGAAFVKAGKEKSMNEAYLMAHALHETGNGTSTLAKGVWVDAIGNVTYSGNKPAKTSQSRYMVYNVYGYGAANACPLDCGARTAFNEKWFTVAQAIVGGADKIDTGYIGNDLNTLYKMRWNPGYIAGETNNWRQYATHTKWATAQTRRIADVYSQLKNHTSKFDVPTFVNMPDYRNGADAKIVGSDVNFRSGPGTSNSSLGLLKLNSKVKVIGGQDLGSAGWYKLNVNGRIGWMHSDYVQFTY